MEIRSQKLSDFFNIGRDRGWDIEKQRWTVHSLVNPEGLTFTLGDILPNGIPVDIRLEKSGSRYGYPPLREAIIRIQQYDLPVENVLVTSGTQHANFLALTVALNAGDEAIVEIPSWEQPRVLCEALGVRTHIVRRRPELGWKLDLNELEGLGSPRLKVIYVCNPGNPTGAVMAADELKKVCDIAARWGSYVVSDEIYRGLEWDGTLTPSVANYYERGVSTSSLSKTLGMGGLRLGWLATPDRNFIERCMELKYYISLHQQSRLDETVALAALEPATYRGLVQRSMTVGRVNYEIVSKWMASSDTFSWVAPQGGFLSFPAYRLDIPSWDLCLRLLDKPYQTYLIPGSCYEYEGHVRLGFGPGTPAETIRVGLERTSQFIADFKAGRVAA